MSQFGEKYLHERTEVNLQDSVLRPIPGGGGGGG